MSSSGVMVHSLQYHRQRAVVLNRLGRGGIRDESRTEWVRDILEKKVDHKDEAARVRWPTNQRHHAQQLAGTAMVHGDEHSALLE